MTPQEELSRISFGKMTNVVVYNMSPCVRGRVGALIIEKRKGAVSEDVTLVFDNTAEVDRLIRKLSEVKELMLKSYEEAALAKKAKKGK
jgi:hypothetical protein